jgi:hypothetical protein
MIGTSTVKRFLIKVNPYIKNERKLSELIAELNESINNNQFDIENNTDRAKFAKKANRESQKMLEIIDALKSGEFLPIIGGQAVAGLAVALGIDIMDLGIIRKFLNN